MSSKPTQTRTVDPFAEYNSNVVNRLTRMLTQNDNVLLSTNSLRLTLDSTAPTTAVVVQTGTVFKDDVLIEVTADHQVDFEDASHYINAAGGGGGELGETGLYYVCLEYTYVKSRPAPDVDIKILKPSQRGTYATATSLLLLGVVEVAVSGIANRIVADPFTDYDASIPANKREYVKFYAGTETQLPVHDTFRDPSRIVYDSETDQFWLGYSDRWDQINAGSLINIDTTNSLAIGDLAYIDTNGEAQLAISTAVATRAELAVLEVGLEADGTGQGRLYGVVEDVPVQALIVMAVGDVCYLSSLEAGTVTNVKAITGGYQNVGKCIAVNASTIDLLFIPGDFLNITQVVSDRLLAGASWTLSGGSYYQDVDISAIGHLNVVVSVRDEADDFMIQPQDIDLSVANTVTIWMPAAHASILNVTVVG